MIKLLKIVARVITGHPLHSLFFILGVTFVGLTQVVSIGSLYPIAQYLMDPHSQPNAIIKQFDRILIICGQTPDLLNYLVLFLAISFISACFYVVLETYQAFFLRNLEYKERQSLLHQVIWSRWESLRNLNHGDFINAVTHEAESYKGLVKYCFIVISELVQIAFFIYFAFIIDSKIVILSLILFSSSVVIFYPFMKKGRSLGHAWINAYSRLTDGLVNAVRSFKSMKTSSMERYLMNYLNDRVFRVCHEYYKQQILSAVQSKMSELTGYFILAIIIYAGVKIMEMKFANIILILVIFTRIVPKTKGVIDSFHKAYSGLPSVDKIEAIKNSSINQSIKGIPLDSELRSIRLQSVSFAYGVNGDLFRDLTITLKKGDFWVVCGPTGGGKTSFLDLLSGIIRPSKGSIFYNDISDDEIDVETLHRRIGYITQDHFIFTGTILENICWGNENPDMSRLNGVIKLSQLEELLREKGADFKIAESGQNLSGGQQQRIAIARVLLNDLDFILMDEPTSSLDQETEHHFISALLEFKGKISIVMVTHRQQNIKYFDHILMLEGNNALEVSQEDRCEVNG
ncbi:MAG: ABC transporter ATP-binding protein [Deltaproteobacteria bacterium]|nr:ABC transporter ATP-binding protein [Deltaproteobacteria bacterium]